MCITLYLFFYVIHSFSFFIRFIYLFIHKFIYLFICCEGYLWSQTIRRKERKRDMLTISLFEMRAKLKAKISRRKLLKVADKIHFYISTSWALNKWRKRILKKQYYENKEDNSHSFYHSRRKSVVMMKLKIATISLSDYNYCDQDMFADFYTHLEKMKNGNNRKREITGYMSKKSVTNKSSKNGKAGKKSVVTPIPSSLFSNVSTNVRNLESEFAFPSAGRLLTGYPEYKKTHSPRNLGSDSRPRSRSLSPGRSVSVSDSQIANSAHRGKGKDSSPKGFLGIGLRSLLNLHDPKKNKKRAAHSLSFRTGE